MSKWELWDAKDRATEHARENIGNSIYLVPGKRAVFTTQGKLASFSRKKTNSRLPISDSKTIFNTRTYEAVFILVT